MSGRNWGNVPLYSTSATITTDPSTATLVGELILSTAAGIMAGTKDSYEVRFAVGGSTSAIWRLEHATSSGLGSSAIAQQIIAFTGSNQTAEYVFTLRASAGDRFRVLPVSSFTGFAAATIQAEALS